MAFNKGRAAREKKDTEMARRLREIEASMLTPKPVEATEEPPPPAPRAPFQTSGGKRAPVGSDLEMDILTRWSYWKRRLKVDKTLGKVQAYEQIAEEVGLEWRTVAGVIYRHRPTMDIAQAKIRAAAARLADRIIEKSNVQEAIDILSRPNIGVLAPMKTNGGSPGGFFLSVQVDSCGAVKVGAASTENPKGLPAGVIDAETIQEGEDAVDEGDYPESGIGEYSGDGDSGPSPQASGRRSLEHEAALQRAREKLARARGQIPDAASEAAPGGPDQSSAGVEGLQGADGGSEA